VKASLVTLFARNANRSRHRDGLGRTAAGALVAALLGSLPACGTRLVEFDVGGFPVGITVGSDGNLWFALASAPPPLPPAQGAIGRITVNGTVETFILPSPEARPWGVTTGPDGNVWFTEAGGNKVGRISPTGEIVEFPLPLPNRVPSSITTGSDGNLWFREAGPGVGRITPMGSISEFPVPGATLGQGSALGPDGNVWFTFFGTARIGHVAPNGTFGDIAAASATDAALDMAAGSDGSLWVTEFNDSCTTEDGTGCAGGHIGHVHNGTITEFPLPESDSHPFAITAGPDGNMWFSETRPDGAFLATITSDGTITENPVRGTSFGMTSGPDGAIWFTEYFQGRVARFLP